MLLLPDGPRDDITTQGWLSHSVLWPVGDKACRVEGTAALCQRSAGAGGLAVIGENLVQQRYR